MGNFDGVHLGHQSVLALAHAAAAELGAPFGVVTFEPHPRAFFAPDAPPFRLMTAEARAHRLEKLGVERLYELAFDAAPRRPQPGGLRRRRARRRPRRRATSSSAPTSASARAGPATPRCSTRSARDLGFGVTVAPLVCDEQGDFSSTAIRAALAEGRPEEAARILGHWHRIEGRCCMATSAAAPSASRPRTSRSTGCTCRASASTRCSSTC